MGALSSSLMVPVPVPAPASEETSALVGLDSSTRKVSAGSSMASWRVVTDTVASVAPAAMVTVVALTAV